RPRLLRSGEENAVAPRRRERNTGHVPALRAPMSPHDAATGAVRVGGGRGRLEGAPGPSAAGAQHPGPPVAAPTSTPVDEGRGSPRADARGADGPASSAPTLGDRLVVVIPPVLLLLSTVLGLVLPRESSVPHDGLRALLPSTVLLAL